LGAVRRIGKRAMKIKTKISLGITFLFLVTLFTGGLGVWYLRQLSLDSKNILRDNYETIDYAQKMLEVLETPNLQKYNFSDFEKNLIAQESNITEVGEKELTAALRVAFDAFKKDRLSDRIPTMKQQIYQIININMSAIVQKNKNAELTAEKATQLLSFVIAFVFLIAFTFAFNFPNYIAEPISKLTDGIKAIANKNYNLRLHLHSNDEFEELANAFNSMAEKLDNYENSNLAKLMFEKRRIETIINNMHDAIVGLDEQKKILFANQVATDLLGVSEFDLLGKYAPDVALNNDLFRNLLQEETENKQIKIFTEGKESYFTKEFLIVNDPENNTTAGTVIILKNITKFQELDLAKTNFIATISHELKTPISAIKMSLKLLEDERIGQVNDEQHKLIQNIKDDSQRLLKITGELLDLSQVETGRINLNQLETSPESIINYAKNTVQTLAEQKEIQIEINLEKEIPNVYADVEKSAWVMVNFLSNAIRYTPEHGKIIVSAKRKNGKVQFSVQDFGKGIEGKFKEKIFDKFFQVPTSSGQEKTGTGLGLAISKDFIEAQNGEISVESELHQGSTFSFTLPIVA
jgi:PAS domain S-box-containing protein